MRWRHLAMVAASVGTGFLAFAGDLAAQKSSNPKTAAPTADSADSLNAEVIRLYEAGKYADAIPL